MEYNGTINPHCGKCKHLKKPHTRAVLDKKGRKVAEVGGFVAQFGGYCCDRAVGGGRWWSFRPTTDFCENFEHR